MRLGRWVFVLVMTGALFGCVEAVDEYGVTDEVIVYRFSTSDGALQAAREKLIILCFKNGYKDVKVLSSSYRRSSKRSSYSARMVGQCVGKSIYKEETE